MSKRFLIVLAVLAVVFGGWLVFSKSQANKKSGGSTGNAALSNHVEGAGNKGVTLVEYGDFQCPACGAYYPIIEQVRKQYGDDLKFQFRSFPLVQKHQNAMAAHRAAEAAAKQDRFWDMYNLLYSQQQTWESAPNVAKVMEDFAMQMSLNVEQFKKDYASEEVNNIINADLKEGQRLGVNSTPTFFINGKKVDPLPNRSVEEFAKLIDEAAKSSSSSSSSQPQPENQ